MKYYSSIAVIAAILLIGLSDNSILFGIGAAILLLLALYLGMSSDEYEEDNNNAHIYDGLSDSDMIEIDNKSVWNKEDGSPNGYKPWI